MGKRLTLEKKVNKTLPSSESQTEGGGAQPGRLVAQHHLCTFSSTLFVVWVAHCLVHTHNCVLLFNSFSLSLPAIQPHLDYKFCEGVIMSILFNNHIYIA